MWIRLLVVSTFIMVNAMRKIKDKILNNIIINKTTGCWEWQKCCSSDGYGQLSYNNKQCTVHRLSYELFVNKIPLDKQILHSCDNPICCNPDHLRVGTNYDNVQDRQNRNRQAKGITHGRHKLTDNDIQEIRRLHSTGKYTHGNIAEVFDISRSHICNILNNKFWKHIT